MAGARCRSRTAAVNGTGAVREAQGEQSSILSSGTTVMRAVDELADVRDPAWPELAAELANAPVPLEVLPIEADLGRECLYRIQVTAASRLGALAVNTGGLLVDHGWLRVLGGGNESRGLASLAQAAGLDGTVPLPPASFFVGHDAIGGRFEINGTDPESIDRPGAPGELCYLGPHTGGWESLEVGHGDWLSWIADGFTTEFYAHVRWPGWTEEVQDLPLSHGIAVFPFLWSREAMDDLAATTRTPVELDALFNLHEQFAEAFNA